MASTLRSEVGVDFEPAYVRRQGIAALQSTALQEGKAPGSYDIHPDTAVALATVLGYLCAEVTECATRHAQDSGFPHVLVTSVAYGATEDAELAALAAATAAYRGPDPFPPKVDFPGPLPEDKREAYLDPLCVMVYRVCRQIAVETEPLPSALVLLTQHVRGWMRALVTKAAEVRAAAEPGAATMVLLPSDLRAAVDAVLPGELAKLAVSQAFTGRRNTLGKWRYSSIRKALFPDAPAADGVDAPVALPVPSEEALARAGWVVDEPVLLWGAMGVPEGFRDTAQWCKDAGSDEASLAPHKAALEAGCVDLPTAAAAAARLAALVARDWERTLETFELEQQATWKEVVKGVMAGTGSLPAPAGPYGLSLTLPPALAAEVLQAAVDVDTVAAAAHPTTREEIDLGAEEN